MEGLFTKSWGTYMTEYYNNTRSLRKGSTWIKRLMKYNWEAVFSIWENKNKQLHNTQRIKELEGLSVLQNAIRAEWGIGLGRLPASQFSHYCGPLTAGRKYARRAHVAQLPKISIWVCSEK